MLIFFKGLWTRTLIIRTVRGTLGTAVRYKKGLNGVIG